MFVEWCMMKTKKDGLDIQPTKITERHIQEIKDYPGDDDPEVILDMIEEPERSKFEDLMKKMGYL